MDNYEEYKEYYAALQQVISDSEDYIEKRTFAIASGGLTLSITILPLLKTYALSALLYIAWGCFVGCLLVNLLSHCITKKQANSMLEEMDTQISQGQEFDASGINDLRKEKNKSITLLNRVAIGLLIVGVICFLLFVYCNIK